MNEMNVSAHISSLFKSLLCEKHLYQSVHLSDTWMDEESVRQYKERGAGKPSLSGSVDLTTSVENLKRNLTTRLTGTPWIPQVRSEFEERKPSKIPSLSSSLIPEAIQFLLPDILSFCPICQREWPFNPNPEDSSGAGITANDRGRCVQRMVLSYECQGCKGLPTKFFVRREGLKLTLVGRDPMEMVSVPEDLPKSVNKYFSKSIISHHAGYTLAGIFYLRVLIEQFWRTYPQISDQRMTGDEMGKIYSETLPTDFKNRFPSLGQVYSNLSEAIHAAKEDAAVFEQAKAELVEHFQARRLFKVPEVAPGLL